MDILTKTDLWKLASIYMGQTTGNTIIDAGAPTTPLEITFDTLYDVIRKELIEKGEFDFARRTARLREAPTVDYRGTVRDWTDSWDYVYARPADALKMLRFEDEPIPGVQSNYEELILPIAYAEVDGFGDGDFIITSSVAQVLPSKLYRNWARFSFYDDNNVRHTVVDLPDGATTLGFDWQDQKTGVVLPGNAAQTYEGTTFWGVDFQPGQVAGVYALTEAPAAIQLEVAYGFVEDEESTINWRTHIATNKGNASVIYLVDATDVSKWPVQFQNAVAYEMAFRAAITHSKSPRVVNALNTMRISKLSEAITALSSDDRSFQGGRPSRATTARR